MSLEKNLGYNPATKKEIDVTAFKPVEEPIRLTKAELSYLLRIIYSDTYGSKSNPIVGGKLFDDTGMRYR